jgi:hypothetical protein
MKVAASGGSSKRLSGEFNDIKTLPGFSRAAAATLDKAWAAGLKFTELAKTSDTLVHSRIDAVTRLVEEVPLVFQRHQRPPSPIVHCHLQGFCKRTHRLDVSLNAQVAEDDEAGLHGLSLDRRVLTADNVKDRFGSTPVVEDSDPIFRNGSGSRNSNLDIIFLLASIRPSKSPL